MLKAGVAGLGGLGRTHTTSLLAMSALVSVDAVADPVDEARSVDALKERGVDLGGRDVRSYANYEDLCTDDELDVVVIATPSDLHAPATILAMEHGKHVFTEKPMALNVADCQRMIDAANANDRTLMVGHCLRFYPNYLAAERIMRSGEYGKVIGATLARHGGGPGRWFAEEHRSGGVGLDLHVHDVDTALWWWGEPDDVTWRKVGSTASATAIMSQWRYEDGAEVQLTASWEAISGFGATFRIIMEKATLVSEKGGLKLLKRDATEEIDLTGQTPGHRAEMNYFIQCLVDDVAPERCPMVDSMLAVKYAQGRV